MTKVILGLTISLDGYAEDIDGSVGKLYPDLKTLRETDVLKESISSTGSVVMSKKEFSMAEDPDSIADNYEYISLSDQALGMLVITLFGLLCLLGLVLTWIDIRHGIIPDWLNLTIAGLGLSKAVIIDGPAAGLEAACEGAAIGAIFWLLRWLYFTFRRSPGHWPGRCQIPRSRRNLDRRQRPSHASVGCHADRSGLCRHHAMGGTAH